MAFDWAEYLKIARFLQEQGGNRLSEEAAFRCAVSRAYYAAFCHARNYARDRHGFSPKYTADDHSLVRRHFQSRRAAGIAIKLDSLRQWRNSCDYSDAVPNLAVLLSSTSTKTGKSYCEMCLRWYT